MKKNVLIVILIIATSIIGCNSEKEKSDETVVTTDTIKTINDNISTNNYAVIWNWKQDNKTVLVENMASISDEMNNLWEKGIISNAYFGKDTTTYKFEDANISCFIKAASKEDAHVILNKLSLIQKGIATYIIHPVGMLWLGRKEGVEMNKNMQTYVAVWSSIEEIHQTNDADLIEKQTKSIMKLWNEGTIENIYWDMDVSDKSSSSEEPTEFVFFINSKSETDAKEICDNLPLTKENKVSYKIKHVGEFWLGENK